MGEEVAGTRRVDPLAELLEELSAAGDLQAAWQRVVNACLTEVEGAEYAGITVLGRESATTPVASDPLVRAVDALQYSTGQGPCVRAAVADTEPVVLVNDLLGDGRWPDFSGGAVKLGVSAMLSFHLYTEPDSTVGALNLYSTRVGSFTPESLQTGALLAAHAAVAAATAEKTGQLRVALASRDLIGQAKGILMERYRITADHAFGLLVAASQRTNRRLTDLAEELATTGQLAGLLSPHEPSSLLRAP